MSATAAVATRRAVSSPKPGAGRRNPKAFLGAIAIVVVGIMWEIAATTGIIREDFFSKPSAIAAAGWELAVSGELATHVPSSVMIFTIGFVGGSAAGVVVGMLIGWKPRVRQALDPLLTALYVTPSIVLMPLFIIALGIGPTSKIVMVFVEVFLTVAVNAAAGVRETDAKLVQAARSFGASERSLFAKVIFPSAFPTLVAGLRLGVGRGIATVILAELYGGFFGIGVLISDYGRVFMVAPLLFLAISIGVVGYVLSMLFRAWEQAILRRRNGGAR